jgi:CBS domain-containing protein
MLVRHFMSTPVFAVSAGDRCARVLGEFRRRRIRRAPVFEEGRIAGLVSERDLLRRWDGTSSAHGTGPAETVHPGVVREVMNPQIQTIRPNDHLELAARTMLQHKISCLLVVEYHKLKGIITESDVFRALTGILSSASGSRIVFEKPRTVQGYAEVMDLCQQHRCAIHALLRCEREEGDDIYYLCVAGGETDSLIQHLWSSSARILCVDRAETG